MGCLWLQPGRWRFANQLPNSQAEVDVAEGVENTPVLLGSQLKDGITVRRQYAEHVPRIQAHGSRLNQVWTNIIGNAIDAVGGRRTITIRISARDGYVVTEIERQLRLPGPHTPLYAAASPKLSQVAQFGGHPASRGRSRPALNGRAHASGACAPAFTCVQARPGAPVTRHNGRGLPRR